MKTIDEAVEALRNFVGSPYQKNGKIEYEAEPKIFSGVKKIVVTVFSAAEKEKIEALKDFADRIQFVREGGIKTVEHVRGRSGYDQEGDYFEEKDYDREIIQIVEIKMTYDEAVSFATGLLGEREMLTVEQYMSMKK